MNERLVWDEHIRQSGRRLFLAAFRILRDEAAAADACQEALCRAWACRGQLRDPQALGAWIHRAVTNECYGRLRKHKLQVSLLVAIDDEQETAACAPQQSSEHDRDVQQAIALLPGKTRSVVLLRLVYGLSGNETSERLGVSASEVSRHLHEGMESLRRTLRSDAVPDRVRSDERGADPESDPRSELDGRVSARSR